MTDMDRRERKRLKDEINRGVPNVGIYKVDGDGLERENRSPLFKGAVTGFGLGASAGLYYVENYGIFNRSPLGLYRDDFELVMLLIMAGGTVMGAAIGWLLSKVVPTRRKPPKATS